MWFNTTGSANTAVGRDVLAFNGSGNSNIAVGFDAGVNLTVGNNNIDIGNPGTPESATIRIGTRPTQNTFIVDIFGVARCRPAYRSS
jgi:hypothetical protein